MACIKTKKCVVELFNNLVNIFPQTGGGGTRKMSAGISFFMVSSSDLKYKLMRHVTFNPLLFWISPGLISCILYEIKKIQCGTIFIKALQCL